MADGTGGSDWLDALFSGSAYQDESYKDLHMTGGGESAPASESFPQGGEGALTDYYATQYGPGGGEEDTSAGGLLMTAGGGQQEAAGGAAGLFGNFVTSAGDTISGWMKEATGLASKLFTNPPSSSTRIDPTTGKPVTVEKPGGGLNSLGQLLIAGAIQGVAGGYAAKAKQAAEEKEKKRERTFKREEKAEEYARKEYGGAPQIGRVTRGTGLLARG